MTQPANELREPNVDYVKPPLLGAWGGFEEAMVLQVEEERICRALDDAAGLDVSLWNQAGCLLDAGRPAKSLRLAEESVAIAPQLRRPAFEDGLVLLKRIREALSS